MTFRADGLPWKGKGRGPAGGATEEKAENMEEPNTTTSPQASATGGSPSGRRASSGEPAEEPPESEAPLSGFFEDELRGYRLLKACHLGHHERQQVLTLTRNSTGLQAIRQALRSLHDEGMADQSLRRPRHTWWSEAEAEVHYGNGWEDPWYTGSTYYQDPFEVFAEDLGAYDQHPDYATEQAYYDEASEYQGDLIYHDQAYDPYSYEDPTYLAENTEEVIPEDEANLMNEEKEAHAIAQEAGRTLAQARAAVAKARAARGYYPLGGNLGQRQGRPRKGQGVRTLLHLRPARTPFCRMPSPFRFWRRRFSKASGKKGLKGKGGKTKTGRVQLLPGTLWSGTPGVPGRSPQDDGARRKTDAQAEVDSRTSFARNQLCDP